MSKSLPCRFEPAVWIRTPENPPLCDPPFATNPVRSAVNGAIFTYYRTAVTALFLGLGISKAITVYHNQPIAANTLDFLLGIVNGLL